MSNPQSTFAAAARIDASQDETDAANTALFSFAEAAADYILSEERLHAQFDELRATLPPAHWREFSDEFYDALGNNAEIRAIIRRWHQMSIPTTILIDAQLQAIIRANLGIVVYGAITAKRGERIMRTDAPINMQCRLLASERIAWDHSNLAGILWEMGFRASRAMQLSNNHKH